MDELKQVIKENDVQIITITESWGQPWKEATLEIDGFTMYRKDRIDGRKGGGCIIYISRELKSYNCRELENSQGDDAIWCWIKLTNETKILIGCMYRTPSSNEDNNVHLMNQIIQANEITGQNRLLLMGDFNLKEINWLEEEAAGPITAIPSRFYECINDCFLHQHVFAPTRFRGEQESTLDLIFTKEEEDVKNIEVIQPLGKSDHGIVICDLICEWKVSNIHRPRRLYHKGNYTEINRCIEEINWELEFDEKIYIKYGNTLNVKWKKF